MPAALHHDAVVVGAGPNGFAAAITLARAGRSTLLIEAADEVGGGTRSAELTLPGFVHDVCSAVHPLATGSPFFQTIPLAEHGLELLHPPLPLAHPLDDGSAGVLHRDLGDTIAALGEDGRAYERILGPLVRQADTVVSAVLGPPRLPRHPLTLARFALSARHSATSLAKAFSTPQARALHAGIASHAIVPLDRIPTASVGLLLAVLGHAYGWPVARGGSQRIAEALTAEFASLGGEIITGWTVETFRELPPARHVVFDLTPRQVLSIAGDRFTAGYRRQLQHFRYGPGVFKVDWALDGPVPWTNPDCRRAGTVHLGGTLEEIAAAEQEVADGKHPARPYVLFAQPNVADPARAPAGQHTGWGYCHVPSGSTVDMTAAIESQIERFAPGFRDRILARSTMDAKAVEAHDANYIGGDINGGIQDLRQLLTRPAWRWPMHSTSDPGIWLCSSSTPPGGGVHGMCGSRAAGALLRADRVAFRRSA